MPEPPKLYLYDHRHEWTVRTDGPYVIHLGHDPFNRLHGSPMAWVDAESGDRTDLRVYVNSREELIAELVYIGNDSSRPHLISHGVLHA